MQVLILHISVARHTGMLRFKEGDGCVIYETGVTCPKTQEQEVQLSFYLKILKSRLFLLGSRRP